MENEEEERRERGAKLSACFSLSFPFCMGVLLPPRFADSALWRSMDSLALLLTG